MRIKYFIFLCALLPACSLLRKKEVVVEINSKSSVTATANSLIKPGHYEVKVVKIGGSSFHLYARKFNGIGLAQMEKSLLKMWPLFLKNFKKAPSDIAIIDFNAAMGGGPLAPYVIGIFTSKKISKAHQDLIEQATGWPPQTSTSKYIASQYGAFQNPEEAYVDDMLVHELGHLFFGWGLTSAPENKNDWWFSFGMGLIYDRLAWGQTYQNPSPLFEKITSKWKDDFSKKEEVDQRLISPDDSKDKSLGLQRLQTYGHGKSYAFLSRLREKLGPEKFDQAMNAFISKSGQKADYEQFIEQFSESDRKEITALESEFKIR
jgi:hypothetical protein